MNYLDGFSGYGGFHLALENAGFKFDNVYFSEMDKHAIANYKYNFPNSIYAGLIQHINRNTIPSIDLFTFGWPCQDNSIAGKRKGQSGGNRSSLLFEAVRIIDEFRPRHFIAENVVGLFSVNAGIDFFKTLEILTYLDKSLPQYDIEMQLCNTRWVLPQNRERLFFIGHLRDGRSKQVFPVSFPCGENAGKGAKTTEEIACTLTTRNVKSRIGCDGTIIKVRSATKEGYELADVGDSINTAYPDSETRRGRVGKGIAQTLLTSNNQVVVIAPNSFRDLTPTEYCRLQGLRDDWTKYGNYDGVIKEFTDRRRYKIGGNGVTVKLAQVIAKKLYDLNYKQR